MVKSVAGGLRHMCSAQRGPSFNGDKCFSQKELYRIPAALIEDFKHAAEIFMVRLALEREFDVNVET